MLIHPLIWAHYLVIHYTMCLQLNVLKAYHKASGPVQIRALWKLKVDTRLQFLEEQSEDWAVQWCIFTMLPCRKKVLTLKLVWGSFGVEDVLFLMAWYFSGYSCFLPVQTICIGLICIFKMLLGVNVCMCVYVCVNSCLFCLSLWPWDRPVYSGRSLQKY